MFTVIMEGVLVGLSSFVQALQHFSNIKESGLISSILVRTLMDRRYYHGIRTAAALALSKCATADLAWVGQFHLMKAFQEFFCFPGSSIPRSNDFTDFTSYYVQKAIPTSMSRIRNLSGACPTSAQKWLLDVLRYNDNSNNIVSFSNTEKQSSEN